MYRNDEKEIMDMSIPTVLNKETGEYEKIFSVEKNEEKHKEAFKEMVTVVMSEQISAYLEFMGIKTLDLANKEHVQTLMAFFLPDNKEKEDKQVEVKEPEKSVNSNKEKDVKQATQKTEKKWIKKYNKKK